MSCTSLARTGLPVMALIGLSGGLLVAGAVLMVVTRKRRSSTTTTVVVLLFLGVSALAVGALGYTPAHAGTPGCGPASTAGAGVPPSSQSYSGSSGAGDPSGAGSSTSRVEPTGSGSSGSRTAPSQTVRASTTTRSDSSPSTPSSPTSSSPPGDGSLAIVQTSTMTGLAPGIAPVAITGTVTNNGPESTFVTTVTVSIAAVTKDPAATAGTCDETDFVLRDVAMPVAQTLAPGQTVAFGGARIGFNDKALNQDACRSSVVTLHYVSA